MVLFYNNRIFLGGEHMQQLKINLDGSEQLAYNAPDFPVKCVDGDLSHFYDYAAGCHWHSDFEILLANDGDIDYFVNGQVVHIPQGKAVFVNANRLHYGFSRQKRECLYTCLVFHPDIFGSPSMATARYVRQFTGDNRPDYLLLTEENTLELIRKIYRLYQEKPGWFELEVMSCISALICRLRTELDLSREQELDAGWLALRQMVGYLQLHYERVIRLEEIAAAGAVCRSKCCRLFREKLNTTPMAYLNRYRLEKAREMLLTTPDSITKIANRCGFDNPSYFTEMFRKTYGETPRMVRQGKG